MKTLLIQVFADQNTDLSIFKNIADNMPGIEVKFNTQIEDVVEEINAQKFDLLIVDLDLPKEEYHKIQKLVALIYPDAAVTEIDLTSSNFVKFKLDQMMAKWIDAQSDNKVKFFDIN